MLSTAMLMQTFPSGKRQTAFSTLLLVIHGNGTLASDCQTLRNCHTSMVFAYVFPEVWISRKVLPTNFALKHFNVMYSRHRYDLITSCLHDLYHRVTASSDWSEHISALAARNCLYCAYWLKCVTSKLWLLGNGCLCLLVICNVYNHTEVLRRYAGWNL